MVSLIPILAVALGTGRPGGFVVLHFSRATGESSRACTQEVKSTGAGPTRTLFRGYRMADGDLLTIKGNVAIRFKASTTDEQIDSLIAATGIEAFSSVARGCRRYALRVAQLEDDAITIAKTLQQSGLVDYATPDFAGARAEGIPSDSLFVDQIALSNSIARNGIAAEAVAVDVAPSNYGMGQVLAEYTGPLMRLGGAAISAQLSSASSSANALALVKSHGITTLRLAIPERNPLASVRVTIYSLDGTPIRQLVNEALASGQYLVGWDGLDDRGRRVQPGVYVAVMTAGSFRDTHRLVVR